MELIIWNYQGRNSLKKSRSYNLYTIACLSFPLFHFINSFIVRIVPSYKIFYINIIIHCIIHHFLLIVFLYFFIPTAISPIKVLFKFLPLCVCILLFIYLYICTVYYTVLWYKMYFLLWNLSQKSLKATENYL